MKYVNIFAAGHHKNSQFCMIDGAHKFGSTYLMRMLRDAFLKKGIEINTPDINLGRKISFEIYIEGQTLEDSPHPKYLLALENPFINPLNQNLEYCRQFDHVFSWNPGLSSIPNFTLLLVPNEIRISSFSKFEERYIFSSLINANKRFPKSIPGDLYEERLALIKWYELHHPEDFRLYGLGWEKPSPAFTKAEKFRRRIDRLRTQLYGYRPFPSFHGALENKGSVYRFSKFAFCYENTKNLDNYITEKIFDAMIYGCVPVYWGASNVCDFIPEDCFIDRGRFKNTSELHDFLKSIDGKAYSNFQVAIHNFLKSSKSDIFKAEEYVNKVVDIVAGTYSSI